MENYFTVNINNIWNNLIDYFWYLKENPLRLIILILDLTIVIGLVYKFIKYSKRTRVWQLLKGIVFILIVTLLSDILHLKILNCILTIFMPYGVIAIIVIFAPELRRMLEQLGTNKLTKYFGIEKDIYTKTKENIYKIVIATMELAKQKTGALIVIERDIQINDIMETGLKLDSEISPQLLVNIFTPNTPLHDGAVVISNNKIAAAACILPLASDKNIAKELGTRHRAAIGLSEISDALVIVVSEETGTISLAINGKITRGYDRERLKKVLTRIIENRSKKKVKTAGEKVKSWIRLKTRI